MKAEPFLPVVIKIEIVKENDGWQAKPIENITSSYVIPTSTRKPSRKPSFDKKLFAKIMGEVYEMRREMPGPHTAP